MKKTGMLICAVVGMGGSMVAHAMDQADCIHVNLAVADMQQALIGAGNLDASKEKLETRAKENPEMKGSLNAFLELAKGVDVNAPMETMDMAEFDRAEEQYQKKYREECGGS
ncbi:hypothetical protein GN155_002190 [Alcanivorax sp. ZXX171]|nr:hypothetical protein [Alcanivorax sp. ZXX171]